jgi:hypothetical protein
MPTLTVVPGGGGAAKVLLSLHSPSSANPPQGTQFTTTSAHASIPINELSWSRSASREGTDLTLIHSWRLPLGIPLQVCIP